MIASLTSLMKNKENRILNNVRIYEKDDEKGRYYELVYWLFGNSWKTRIEKDSLQGKDILRDMKTFQNAKSFKVEIIKDKKDKNESFRVNLEQYE